MEEAELLRRPEHHLLTDAGEVEAENRQVEQRLGHEVPVAHRVEGVLEPGGEAQLVRGGIGVERQRGAGEGAGAQRADVEAGHRVEEPVDVPGQRPAVGQQVVGQEDGLGPLEVGVAGEVGVARLLGPVQQHALQSQNLPSHDAQLPAAEEAQRGDHLVVAAAPRVQLGSDRAGDLRGAPLDGGVDVLVVGSEAEGAGRQLLAHVVQRRQQDGALLVGEHAGPLEAAHVGTRRHQVVPRQPLVEREADGERQQLLRRPVGEPPFPECHRLS